MQDAVCCLAGKEYPASVGCWRACTLRHEKPDVGPEAVCALLLQKHRRERLAAALRALNIKLREASAAEL